ncbi:MAG TPA: 4-hydroxy-tetrahydrodipicolinate reductase [Candidatus Omnitrophota bacterium]|nr:4-hydroxy-tetrahydrodipicolinate reductase [Candidatus Omnitrophota bacterium]
MIKLAITGACGRMGQKIYSLAKQDKRFSVTALLERLDHPQVNKEIDGIKISSDFCVLKDNVDVLIDFTLPEGTMQSLEACVQHKIPIVIGTTGLSAEQAKKVSEAAKIIPVIYGTNMSIGVNVLFKITELIGKKLAQTTATDIAIYEEHHIHKKDAPSGTAKTLAEIAEKTSGQKARFDPQPLRQGEIIGNHRITFETKFDTLELYHSAKDRAMFALGALEAAHFLTAGRPAGLYTMQQVLELDKIIIQ